MSVPLRRRGIRLASGVVVASVMAAGSATSASAATAVFPHVTLALASKAFPTAKDLPPGGVHLLAKVQLDKSGVSAVCGNIVPLKDLGEVGAIYAAPGGSLLKPNGAVWALDVSVFATPAGATSAADKVIAVQKKCPRSRTEKDGADTFTSHTSVSAPYTVDGWVGYHTVTTLTFTINGKTQTTTSIDVALARGNVIVEITEATGGTQVPLATQDTRRKSVQKRMLAAVADLKG